jgi:hypothetical protein
MMKIDGEQIEVDRQSAISAGKVTKLQELNREFACRKKINSHRSRDLSSTSEINHYDGFHLVLIIIHFFNYQVRSKFMKTFKL